jgi:hypothetical protein
MRLLIATALAFAALLAGSCAPTVPAEADLPPMARAEHEIAQACEEEGGELMQVGRMQTEQCVVPFADGGKVCRDGDDCQGNCYTETAGVQPSGPVTGRCAANALPFGCLTPVEDGQAGPTLCVD